MFHVKHRRLGLFAGLAILGALAVSCGNPGGQPRGWAEPVVSGNNVIVSSGRGRIDAIDTQTNILRWRFPNFWSVNGNANDTKGFYGSPVVAGDNDTVFVADYNGYIYAFRQSQAPTASQLQSDAPRPPAATLYLGDPVIGGIALDPVTNDVFVTSGERLLRLRYASDRLTSDWVFHTGAANWSTPVLIPNNRLLLASLDGSLYALDRSNGSVAWRYSTGGAGLVSRPLVIGNTVYVGGFDSKLHAVDLTTGEGKWTFQASYWVWSAPVADGNTLIVGDFNGTLYGVDASTGQESWRVDLKKGPIVGSPALSQGTIVVATDDGHIVGLSTSTREVRWERKLSTGIIADLVPGDGVVFMAPRGCVTPEGTEQRTYYYGVNPANGELRQAQDVC